MNAGRNVLFALSIVESDAKCKRLYEIYNSGGPGSGTECGCNDFVINDEVVANLIKPSRMFNRNTKILRKKSAAWPGNHASRKPIL